MIDIDFTGSNGDPDMPSSLHYITENIYNDYQKALHSVSEILLQYDTDKLIRYFLAIF